MWSWLAFGMSKSDPSTSLGHVVAGAVDVWPPTSSALGHCYRAGQVSSGPYRSSVTRRYGALGQLREAALGLSVTIVYVVDRWVNKLAVEFLACRKSLGAGELRGMSEFGVWNLGIAAAGIWVHGLARRGNGQTSRRDGSAKGRARGVNIAGRRKSLPFRVREAKRGARAVLV